MLDVAIIGAGAAGLGAANAAIKKGFSVKVLEASSIPGGRARTDTTRLGVPYDLGCRSIYGGPDNPFLAFAREIGAKLALPTDNMIFHDGIRFLDARESAAVYSDYECLEAALISAHKQFSSTPHVSDRSQTEAIDTENPSIAYFLQSMHLECTASSTDISLADPMHTVLDTEGEEVIDGYGALILQAAQDVSVVVDCPVSSIDLSGQLVALDTTKGRIEARTVVVTVSTAVLAAERIALHPGGWPNQKLTAIDALPLGSVTKMGLRLEPGTLPPDLTKVQGNAVTGSVIRRLMPEPQNLLWLLGTADAELATAYVGGAFSRELALAGEDTQVDWAMQQLSDLFGSSVKTSLLASCATPFDREPWIDGGYSYCRYGAGNHRAALAEPIEDRVFFAGEACSPDHPGTAHGAWLSGEAAIELVTAKSR